MATLGDTLSTDQVMYPGALGAAPASSVYLEGGATLGDVPSSAVYPASHYLDPDGTITAQWTGANPHTLLDDAVRQPTAPTTGSDRITTTTSGQVDEVSLETATKRKTITSVVAWWHGKNSHATRATVTLALVHGTTVIASQAFTDTAEAWYSITYAGDLTQAQVDDLRIRLTYAETGSTTALAIANEVYAEVIY